MCFRAVELAALDAAEPAEIERRRLELERLMNAQLPGPEKAAAIAAKTTKAAGAFSAAVANRGIKLD